MLFRRFFVPNSEIFNRIEALCNESNISISALITEITGSSGNAPTWKKGHIRSDYLKAICLKFNVSSDFVLGIDNQKFDFSENEKELLALFNDMSEREQLKLIGRLELEREKFSNKEYPKSET